MRAPHRSTHGADLLAGDAGIAAEELTKVYHELDQRAFTAPTPLLTRAFRGKRPVGMDEETVEDDDDDDGGADEVEAALETPDFDEDQGAVWALRGASFRIPRGAAVGLIGATGSGKTTLLRVLAGAVPPTSGRAVLAGQPSPLINLSTPLMAPTFAPAVNAALAAGLVGVTKRRMRPHFDAIVELAEITEKEVRAGVTRMPRKLAVAAAVELESEVLLLDDPFELATPGFRERVIEAIQRRGGDGATVLLETRDRDAMRRICDLALWLDGGTVARVGPIDEVLGAYDASAAATRSAAPHSGATTGFNETVAVVSGTALAPPAGGGASIDIRLELASGAVTLQTGVGLERSDGLGLWFEQPDPVFCELPGFHRFRLETNDMPEGRYSGTIQARVLTEGTEAVVARRRAFELVVGTPAEAADSLRPTSWERREASWLYEPETPP